MDELIRKYIKINNPELLARNGLMDQGELNSAFFTLYKNYNLLLDKYLVDKLKLNVYDKNIEDAGLMFFPEKREDMDFYQYISAMGLKYLYLRNDLYVEKLSKEIVDRLISLKTEDLAKPGKEITKLIEATYKRVIDVSPESDGSYMSRYGPDGDRFWFPSNELVIGLRYDMFADNGLGEEDVWLENHNKQISFIAALMEEINAKGNDLLGVPVNLVLYTEFTIDETVAL